MVLLFSVLILAMPQAQDTDVRAQMVDGGKGEDVIPVPVHMPPIVLPITALVKEKEVVPVSFEDPRIKESESETLFRYTEIKLTSTTSNDLPIVEEAMQEGEPIPESFGVVIPSIDVITDDTVLPLSEEDALYQERGMPIYETFPNDTIPPLSEDALEILVITIPTARETVLRDASQQVLELIPGPIPVVDEPLSTNMTLAVVECAPGPRKPLVVTTPIIDEPIFEDALQRKLGLIPEFIPAIEKANLEDTSPIDTSSSPSDALSAPIPEFAPDPLDNLSSPVVVPAVPSNDNSSLEDVTTEHTLRARRRVRRSIKRERKAAREQVALLASTSNLLAISSTFQSDPPSSDQQASSFHSDHSAPDTASPSTVRQNLVLDTHQPDVAVSTMFEDVPQLPSLAIAIIVDDIPENALQQPALTSRLVLAVDEVVSEDVTSTNPDNALTSSGNTPPIAADLMLGLVSEPLSVRPPPTSSAIVSVVGESLSEDNLAHAGLLQRQVRRSVRRERRALRKEAQLLSGLTAAHPSPRTSDSQSSASSLQVQQLSLNRSETTMRPDLVPSTQCWRSPPEAIPVASSCMSQQSAGHLSREESEAGWQLVSRRRGRR